MQGDGSARADRWSRWREDVEVWLDGALPRTSSAPRVHDAMRYSVLGGGKRLRPVLALAIAHALELEPARVLPAASCIELLHASSLVHDDLPSMDDDDVRRGRPACHKQFGEAAAVLAGDALIVLAFERLAEQAPVLGGEAVARLVAELASAAGSLRGLVAGQASDLWPAEDTTTAALERTHAAKTGALFGLATLVPALVAQRPDAELARFRELGVRLGVAFQIANDVEDVTGSERATGRGAGSDRRAGRTTYTTLVGVSASRARASALLGESLAELRALVRSSMEVEALVRSIAP